MQTFILKFLFTMQAFGSVFLFQIEIFKLNLPKLINANAIYARFLT